MKLVPIPKTPTDELVESIRKYQACEDDGEDLYMAREAWSYIYANLPGPSEEDVERMAQEMTRTGELVLDNPPSFTDAKLLLRAALKAMEE